MAHPAVKSSSSFSLSLDQAPVASGVAVSGADSAVTRAAQTAFSVSTASAAAGPSPFALVSRADPLNRSLSQPAFKDEQVEFVDRLLRSNPVAAAHIPFVHLLHLSVFQRADALKRSLERNCATAGLMEQLTAGFKLVNPTLKLQYAFFLLYANHGDLEAVKAFEGGFLAKPFMGIDLEVKLMISFYQGLITKLDGKVKRSEIQNLRQQLNELDLALNTMIEFGKSLGSLRSDQLFLRAQKQSLKKTPTREQCARALDQLAKDGMQDLMGSYFYFTNQVKTIENIGLYRTHDFSTMAKKTGLETILDFHGLQFVQTSLCDELQFVIEQLDDPLQLEIIQRELDCQDMEPAEIAQAFRAALALQESVLSLNASVGALTAEIGSLNDPSDENAAKLEDLLDELAEELGIQRKPQEPEIPESVLSALEQFDALQATALAAQPSPIFEDAPPAVEPSPVLRSALPPAEPSPRLKGPGPAIPLLPRTPRAQPKSVREQALAKQAPEENKEAAFAVSPPRIRRGMNLRKVLRALKEKGIKIVRQKGSHRQTSARNTVALHPGATLGPRTAKNLNSLSGK